MKYNTYQTNYCSKWDITIARSLFSVEKKRFCGKCISSHFTTYQSRQTTKRQSTRMIERNIKPVPMMKTRTNWLFQLRYCVEVVEFSSVVNAIGKIWLRLLQLQLKKKNPDFSVKAKCPLLNNQWKSAVTWDLSTGNFPLEQPVDFPLGWSVDTGKISILPTEGALRLVRWSPDVCPPGKQPCVKSLSSTLETSLVNSIIEHWTFITEH